MSKKIIASLDVDPQKGFTNQTQINELPVAGGESIVGELNSNAKLARYRTLSRDLHVKGSDWEVNTSDLNGTPLENPSKNVDVHWNCHTIHGEEGAEILDGLPHVITGYDFQVPKGTERDSHPYGACYTDLAERQHTGLIAQLKMWEVDTVIVGGLAFDFCVATTVRQLAEAGFQVIVNKAATASIFTDKDQETIRLMESWGAVVLSDASKVKEYLEG